MPNESPPGPASEPARLDAIVLAGTRGAAPFELEGVCRDKPYLELGGEPLVRRSVRAALDTARVERVYVVGDPPRLAEALSPLAARAGGRLRLVPEGEDLLENGSRAYLGHLLPDHGLPALEPAHWTPAGLAAYRAAHPMVRERAALVLPADLPFVRSGQLADFLERAPADAAMVVGLVDHRVLARLEEALGQGGLLDRWKLGSIPLRRWDVRLNNLWLVRPLCADPALFPMVREIYSHRWLLGQDGSILGRNWWGITRAFGRQLARVERRGRYLRGLFNFVPAAAAMAYARGASRLGRALAWPGRCLLGQADVESIGSWLFGGPARMAVSDDPAPAIDIDVVESYRDLAADGERIYRRLAELLGCTEG